MLYLAYVTGMLQCNSKRLETLETFSISKINALIKNRTDLQKDIEKAEERIKKAEEKAVEIRNAAKYSAQQIKDEAKEKASFIKLNAKAEADHIEHKAAQQAEEKARIIEQKARDKETVIEAHIDELESQKRSVNREIEKAKRNYDKTILELEKLAKKKTASYPLIAGLISDYFTLHYRTSAEVLENKKNPAKAEALRIRELQKETKAIIAEKKNLEYKIAYIEAMFPNINDIFDPGFNEQADFELETEENTDRVRLFLSSDEYATLTTTEKNQLALDRYVESRKSKWQIGRDYEMYVGHLLESQGFKVQYTGILENLEDMGRDLIASSGKQVYIIQCKNWSEEKTIHEKHIFQLYGTVILYKIDNPFVDVDGVFVTTTKLSTKARAVADELGIKLYESVPLGEFPRIKCNVNRATNEKIYHLPFDQQYDKTVIEKQDGEFYAFTVKDAEDQGFRRAWRHFSA